MSQYISSGVTRNPDAIPADEQCQVVPIVRSDAVLPEAKKSSAEFKPGFLDRYKNPDSLRKIVDGILWTGGILGLAAIAGFVGMNGKARSDKYEAFMNQLRASNQIEYLVQPGDALLNCGFNEGMTTEQSTYNTRFIEEQNGLGPSGTIYEGSEIKVPDVNRDGSVSCSDKK